MKKSDKKDDIQTKLSDSDCEELSQFSLDFQIRPTLLVLYNSAL